MKYSLLMASFSVVCLRADIQSLEGRLEYLGSITVSELADQAEGDRSVDTLMSQPWGIIPTDLPVDASEKVLDYYQLEGHSLAQRQPLTTSPAPMRSFMGLDDFMRTIPPDTTGSVGLYHVVTTLNDRIRIQTRTGIVRQTIANNTFWQTADSVFDPKIMYDPFFNRWISVILASPHDAHSRILIAVSRNSDPTGTWDRYSISADAAGQIWADFPSIGFNNKWIVIQSNMFMVGDGSFATSHIYVVNKVRLYNRVAPFEFKLFPLPNAGGTQTPALTYDNDQENLYLLQNWNGNFNGMGFLRLYAITGDVGSEQLSPLGFVSMANTWGSSSPMIDGGFAPQKDTSRRIMTNDSRILSLVVRNGSLWAAHTVFLPSNDITRSAVQWMQLSPTGLVQQLGHVEDPFATLESGTYFAFPSIAVNVNNDLLIGYSFFNSLYYPSAGYSYRAATDIPNTLRCNYILKSGRDIYTKDFGRGRIRWGDYSNTVIDPNGQDFWTIQECSDLHAINGQSRWLTWWAMISPEGTMLMPPLNN